jgi:hypothetical protein
MIRMLVIGYSPTDPGARWTALAPKSTTDRVSAGILDMWLPFI